MKEYKKLEKIQLARESKTEYMQRLSDLRMFIAAKGYLNIQQGYNDPRDPQRRLNRSRFR